MSDAGSVRQMQVLQALGFGLFSLVESRKTSLISKSFEGKEEPLELYISFDEP